MIAVHAALFLFGFVWLIWALAVTVKLVDEEASGWALPAAVYLWSFYPLYAASLVLTNKRYRAGDERRAIRWTVVPVAWVTALVIYLGVAAL